jgi:hypothetical protein
MLTKQEVRNLGIGFHPSGVKNRKQRRGVFNVDKGHNNRKGNSRCLVLSLNKGLAPVLVHRVKQYVKNKMIIHSIVKNYENTKQ